MGFSISDIRNIGTVLDEQMEITNSIISIPIPGSKTSSTINMNLMGKKRIISIQGINFGKSYGLPNYTVEEKINEFIKDVEDWVNGSGFQSTRTVTDSFGNTYNCLCTSFRWQRSESSPTWIIFSMTLLQGGLTT